MITKPTELCRIYSTTVKNNIFTCLLYTSKAYILMQDNSMTKNEFIKKALIYIHQNYSKDISVSRIAGFLHISTNHFIRVFKFLLGVTPQKYIQTYRIQQAINAMHSAQGVSELSVSDIAFEVGFQDVYKRQVQPVTNSCCGDAVFV